jgi:hypothetical protein
MRRTLAERFDAYFLIIGTVAAFSIVLSGLIVVTGGVLKLVGVV